MKSITLWGLKQLGLIILCKSGVTYHNQVGGYACNQESAEGVLAIFEDYNNTLLSKLAKATVNEFFLTAEKAELVNNILTSHFGGDRFLSLNMEKIASSKEAWLHVIVEDDFRENELMGFAGDKGILTWENSD